jgi:hypothetical protein
MKGNAVFSDWSRVHACRPGIGCITAALELMPGLDVRHAPDGTKFSEELCELLLKRDSTLFAGAVRYFRSPMDSFQHSSGKGVILRTLP